MAKTSSKPKAEYAIQTVTNALRMLEVFHAEAEMGVSDLARQLGLHKNNAFRLLATLELAGYVQQSADTDLYHLGPRCLELGEAFKRSHRLMELAPPILEKLAAETGETAHLGSLVGDQVLHLDARLPEQLILTGSRVGQRLPSHCTALGKALLAAQIDSTSAPSSVASAVEAVKRRDLAAHSRATIVDPMKLLEELRGAQMRGYAVDCEEYSQGLCCVAAPIRDASTRVVAALSLSGPSFRFPEDALHGDAAEAIVAGAAKLSEQLGASR